MHVNPLHPNISLRILHTVLYTFSEVSARMIFLNSEELLSLVIFSFILTTLMFDSGLMLWGEISS